MILQKNLLKLAKKSKTTYSNILKRSNKFLNIEENMVKEYSKSLSNTSTTSVESGIFEMEFSQFEEDMKKMTIGEAVERVLIEANQSGRLISGLKNSITHLNETETPEDSLFFFMAPTRDHASHMSTILLKAFCFENDIYIVQLDSAEKLSKLINIEGATCALVQRSSATNKSSMVEEMLIDHCEDFWDELVQPIIKLPET